MKKIFTLFIGLASLAASAQDTTALRLASISNDASIFFYDDDSTQLVDNTFDSGSGSGHALFMNPADSLMYMVYNDGSGRNLYKVDPFAGTMTLVHTFADAYIHTADINGNVIYAVYGNGSSNASQVIALDLGTMTETNLYITGATNSRALEFNPVDSSLYIYEGYSDLVWVYDLATATESSLTTTGLNDELHGAYYVEDEDMFFITAYGGEHYTTDNTYLNGTYFEANGSTVMDITHYLTVRATSDTIKFCPNADDSTMLNLIYAASNFSWYKDGVVLPFTNDSIWIFDAGTYRALMEVGTTGIMVWSEPIVIQHFTLPVIVITEATNETTICPGETLVLTGASGGGLQWYKDGVLLAGETSSTLDVTAAGSYNQMKTNLSGCSDTAAVPYVVLPGVGCDSGIESLNNTTVVVYPNPAQDMLYVNSQEPIEFILIYDMTGKIVINSGVSTSAVTGINISSLNIGTYVIEIHAENGISKQQFVK